VNAIRVSLTVPTLVVVSNRFQDSSAEFRDNPDQLRAPHDVSLHQCSLFWRQAGFFAKQRSKLFVNLPNVVQKCGSRDLLHLLSRDPKLK
jgi:hypothetical protein